MATVLSPIVQTSGSITMPYTSSDAYQGPSQSKNQQQRSSQMPRNPTYNGTTGGTGYRGTSTPIAPYAFSSTPQLRQENRSVSAPNGQVLQQLPSHVNQARLGHPSHPSSSSDSTVSTSGSSNRSLVGPPLGAKDDSDLRKSADTFVPSISLSIPDLSFSMGDAPVKPSPGRYRRGAGRTDSSTSIPTGASTPTQRSSSAGFPAQPAQNAAPSGSGMPSPTKSGHNRASSADDTQIPRTGGTDPAKRYRRRSLSGMEAGNATASAEPSSTESTAMPNTTSGSTLSNGRPPSNSGRPGSRPSSSQGHKRQGSAGSVSSNTSSRSQVLCAFSVGRAGANIHYSHVPKRLHRAVMLP